ncbi:hypothetical protein O4J56_03885 [Nocardiopsis sp. RSe5-2]|uniref:DUF6199 domain-containing protein n=1 Tax=Nocardiopsis endophytica TaxID=3018445 RepID=A0ABT4TYJ1_9ACTN|nr:hypothetical protein [Nocardiopsis endophytica]MDA2809771.1 hypothetical protein [Nocardiopsis endophytica]
MDESALFLAIGPLAVLMGAWYLARPRAWARYSARYWVKDPEGAEPSGGAVVLVVATGCVSIGLGAALLFLGLDERNGHTPGGDEAPAPTGLPGLEPPQAP